MGRFYGAEPVAAQAGQVDHFFFVDQVVKGDLPRQIVVRTGVGADELGFSLERDVATGILLDREGGIWVGGLCGQVTPSQLVEATRDDDVAVVNWGGIAVGVLVLGAGAYFLARKWRRKRYGPAP